MKPSAFNQKMYALNVIKTLRQATKGMNQPMVFLLRKEYGSDPFIVLISCLLSLRTRDIVTLPICHKLFAMGRTPQQLLKIQLSTLEKLFHPLGFYRQKARLIHSVSKDIIERFGGKVPSTEPELLSIKGVGRKTANLVLGQGFGIPAICVDTHVHRLANQLDLVKTKTPAQTEQALKDLIPKKYWIDLNNWLVMWGQNVPRKEQVTLLKKLMYEKNKNRVDKKG